MIDLDFTIVSTDKIEKKTSREKGLRLEFDVVEHFEDRDVTRQNIVTIYSSDVISVQRICNSDEQECVRYSVEILLKNGNIIEIPKMQEYDSDFVYTFVNELIHAEFNYTQKDIEYENPFEMPK